MASPRPSVVRHRAKRLLDDLPTQKLAAALSFLHYLETEEEWSATREVLADRRAVRQVRASRRAWAKGSRKAFVRWESAS